MALLFGNAFDLGGAVDLFDLGGGDNLFLLAEDASVVASTGTFTLTGNDAGLLVGRVLNAETGVFTLTGNDADFAAGNTLLADTGVFTLTGQDATFGRTYVLACSTGAFTLTGSAASLVYSGEIEPVHGYAHLRVRVSRVAHLRIVLDESENMVYTSTSGLVPRLNNGAGFSIEVRFENQDTGEDYNPDQFEFWYRHEDTPSGDGETVDGGDAVQTATGIYHVPLKLYTAGEWSYGVATDGIYDPNADGTLIVKASNR